MALTNCTECNHQISSSAETCPNCGVRRHAAPSVEKRHPVLNVIGAIVFVIVVFVVGEMLWVPTSQAVVAELAPADIRGAYMGAFGSAPAIGFAIAPLIGLQAQKQLRRRDDLGAVRRHRRRGRGARRPRACGSRTACRPRALCCT